MQVFLTLMPTQYQRCLAMDSAYVYLTMIATQWRIQGGCNGFSCMKPPLKECTSN